MPDLDPYQYLTLLQPEHVDSAGFPHSLAQFSIVLVGRCWWEEANESHVLVWLRFATVQLLASVLPRLSAT
jgi:hypothetical protein